MSLSEKLDVIVKFIPILQGQGVTSIVIDGIAVHFRGMPQADTSPSQETPAPNERALTMGLPGSTRLPSLRDRRGG